MTGSSHAAGPWDEELKHEGWWNEAIGPGKIFDTDKYFIIVPNVLGSCYGTTGPTSINPKTRKPYRMDFPVITITDMVDVQYALLKNLGIKKLLAVVGGSMGGMQVLEWIVRYPEKVHAAVPIATCARLSPQAIALNYVGRKAITLDPEWKGGKYKSNLKLEGLRIARMVGHITYLSYDSMWKKFGREHTEPENYYKLNSLFQVESYLEYQGHKFVKRFDANSYIYLSKAMDLFDMEREYGSLENAFSKVQAKVLLISFTSDWLFPAVQSKEIYDVLKKLGKDVKWVNIESVYGHDAFLVKSEIQKMAPHIIKFLEEARQSFKI